MNLICFGAVNVCDCKSPSVLTYMDLLSFVAELRSTTEPRHLFRDPFLSLVGNEKITKGAKKKKTNKMASKDTKTIVLFDVDGTLTKPRLVCM